MPDPREDLRVRKTMATCAIALLSFFIATPAYANSLVNTSPISGSILSTPPSAVTLTTQVALLDAGNSVIVTDPKGTRVDDGALTVDGMNVIIGLQSLTLSGDYTVTYALLADNNAPLKGSYTFSFSAPSVISSPTPIDTSATTAPTTASSSSATSLFVIGLLFAAFVVLVLLSLYARKIFKER